MTETTTTAMTPDAAAAQIDAWGFEDGVRGFQAAFAFWDLVADGIAGPLTAEAVAHVVGQGDRLSEHFYLNELRSKGNGKVRAHRQLLRRADELRRRKGPFSPVSAYRDRAHNREVGGAENSQHLHGTAFDLSPSLGLTTDEATEIGFSGIGRSGGVVTHVDVRAEGPQNVTGSALGRPEVWDYQP